MSREGDPSRLTPPRLKVGQLVLLVDAALRSSSPAAYLDGIAASFVAFERSADADAARGLAALFHDAEIELVMSLRAEWARRAAQA